MNLKIIIKTLTLKTERNGERENIQLWYNEDLIISITNFCYWKSYFLKKIECTSLKQYRTEDKENNKSLTTPSHRLKINSENSTNSVWHILTSRVSKRFDIY